MRHTPEKSSEFSSLVELLRTRAEEQPDLKVYTFLVDGEHEEVSLTAQELDRRTRAIGALLQSHKATGERALLLYPPGLEYITAFYGCLYGHVIAVPAYPPDPARLNRTLPRLQAIVADARPKLVLTTQAILSMSKMMFAQAPDLASLDWVATDNLPDTLEAQWVPPRIEPSTLAFLQYTSGSTAAPKGVMLSHKNLLHNLSLIDQAFSITPQSIAMVWLPPFHDMGLIGGIMTPLYRAFPIVLMSPLTFLQRPLRWLQAVTRYKATISGGPNFAYDMCAKKITPEQRESLDLSSWEVAFNGAEPVHHRTFEQFAQVFEPCGFQKKAFYPCYGLAESTLFVSGSLEGTGVVVRSFRTEALEHNQVVETAYDDQDSQTLVGCGQPHPDQKVIIVDPESFTPCPSHGVGEIWISGPSVAQGYWGRPEATKAYFRASLKDTEEGPFLRTGDMGFLKDGELFVTGRIKDLIIIRGRNHYPQDIERVVERCHPSVRLGCCAAFSIDKDDEEHLVVVAEVDKRKQPFDGDTVITTIRQAVVENFDLQPYAVVLLKARTIAKTSSGKIQRHASKRDFLKGSLDVEAEWCQAGPSSKLDSEVEEDVEQPIRQAKEDSPKAQAIQAWLVAQLAERLGIDPHKIDIRQPFSNLGLDSKEAISLSGDLEEWLGQRLSPTVVYNYPNIRALSLYLTGERDLSVSSSALGTEPWSQSEPIAIVGLDCRFPGANNAQEFWELLQNGREAITEVPKDRWDMDAFYDTNPDAPGKIYSRFGGFLKALDQFDSPFFKISPREALSMDPQQRLLLEVTWDALEQAGQVPDALTETKTGVFIGISSHDYANLMLHTGDPTQIDAYAGTGNAASVATGRISYILGLQGPNIALDTACSSSLVSVHLACQSLRMRECDMAIAGGVNAILSPESSIFLCRGHGLSPDGHCKAFDASANGYVRGEGCGIIVLKRLSDALENRDHILALIRGSAINQDGSTNGLTAPNGLAQQAVIQSALEEAGIPPHAVSYVETHGPGTFLGDPIEVNALGSVFGGDRPQDTPLLIGSVKTNIGHLEAAAGIASLIKTVLSLQNGLIPESLHFKEPNPHIPWQDFPIVVANEKKAWTPDQEPRIAGVSSFGMSGTNAHLILEEAPQRSEEKTQQTDHTHFLLPLSAKTPEALHDLADAYKNFLNTECFENTGLQDLCYSAGTRRSHYPHRLAVVAPSQGKFIENLEAFLQGKTPGGVLSGQTESHPKPSLVFVFPGYGSQWIGMGQKLLEKEPVFKKHLEACDEALRKYTGWSLMDELGKDKASARFNQVEVIQPLLVAIEIALAKFWQSWGVEPDVVIGHSMGEVAAAHIAGALSLDDTMKLIYHRSRLLVQMMGKGATGMVGLSLEQTEEALKPYAGRLSVAVSNSPDFTMISGDRDALYELLLRLTDQKVYTRRFKPDIAAHSFQMDPLLPELKESVTGIRPQPTSSISFFSTVQGEAVNGEALTPDYWVKNFRDPVLLFNAVQKLIESGHTTFMEISPHPVLVRPIQEGFAHLEREGLIVPSWRRDQDELAMMLDALGTLYAHGYSVDWQKLYPSSHRWVSLPTYPWQHQSLWFDRPGDPSFKRSMFYDSASHPLLGEAFQSSVHTDTHFFEAYLNPDRLPYLKDHQLQGEVVFPGAGYIEMFLGAAAQTYGLDEISLEHVHFKRILFLPEGTDRKLQLVFSAASPGQITCQIASPQEEGDWNVHATASLQLESVEKTTESKPLEAIRQRCQDTLTQEAFYQLTVERGGGYGPSFQGIKEIWRREGEVLARLKLPETIASQAGRYQIHPALLDSCFQMLGAMPQTHEDASRYDAAYVPVSVKKLRLHRTPEQEMWGHALLRAVEETHADYVEGDLFLINDDGNVILEVLGLRAQKLELDALQKHEEEDWLYELTWQEQERPSVEPDSSTQAQWLIFSDKHEVGLKLRSQLEARGEKSVCVFAGEGYERTEAGDYRINPTIPEGFQQVLQNALDTPCRGIVHLWSLDAALPEETTFKTLEEAQDLGCVSTLYLIQAINQIPRREAPRLWLVTQGVHPIGNPPPSSVSIAQAPIWGMGRTIAYEHPELRCSRVDLSLEISPEEIQSLGQELQTDGDEDQIALRKNKRYVARLARTSFEKMDAAQKETAQSIGRREVVAGEQSFRLELDTPGVLDQLTLRAFRNPNPKAYEVEIEVEAAGLNFNDVMKAMGLYPRKGEGPIPLGSDCAGRIRAIGEGVEHFEIGQKVVGVGLSCMASHLILPAQFVSPIPASLSFEEAAGIPIAFMTAWYALHHLGRIRKGERILIHSASGGVGLAAVQIAQKRGAEIFATAGTPEKRAFLKDLGIPYLMDSRSLTFADEIMAYTQGEGVDLVLNTLSGEGFSKSMSVLAYDGKFLDMTVRDIYENRPLELGHFKKRLSYFAIDLAGMAESRPQKLASLLEEVMEQFEKRVLSPLPTKTFPISEAVDAFYRMAQSKHTGKLVIRIDHQKPVPVMPPSRLEVSFEPDATYLITGGAGGLGLSVAQRMAESGVKHLVLVGRSGVRKEAQPQVDAIKALGVNVVVERADVSKHDEVENLLTHIKQTMPPLKGIIHAAGVLADGMILKLDQECFRTVMAPKIFGAWSLHSLTSDTPLDFFILYSSAASLLGSPGQANYCAANAFLDALSHYRHLKGLPALSINWGPFSEIGGAAQKAKEGTRSAFHGIGDIAPNQGLGILEQLLQRNAAQVGVVPLNVRQWIEFYPTAAELPMWTQLAQEEESFLALQAGKGAFRKILENAEPSKRLALLENHIRDQIAAVLRLDVSQIQPHTPFGSLGFDSLLGLELKNRLENDLGIKLTTSLLYTYPNLAGLVPYLGSQMGYSKETEKDGGKQREEEQEAKRVAEVQQLTEEDMQAMIEAELANLETSDED